MVYGLIGIGLILLILGLILLPVLGSVGSGFVLGGLVFVVLLVIFLRQAAHLAFYVPILPIMTGVLCKIFPSREFFKKRYHIGPIYGTIAQKPPNIIYLEEWAMKCPFCSHPESKVVDSRPSDEGASIRRRRECLDCRKRFTTYETMESLPMVVIKKDGSRQTFDRSKLLNSMLRACEKRTVSFDTLQRIADEIEQALQNEMDREISSARIGELVMEKLKDVDEVSYVRFASVYRQFKDINTFMSELSKLLQEK